MHGLYSVISDGVWHYVKSVRIRSLSGLYFPTVVLNTEKYGLSLRIQSECGKIQTRKTPNTDTFHAVWCLTYCTRKKDILFWPLWSETTFELDKSNHPELFCQKGGLRSFAKLTGKHLYLRTATLLKKRLWHRRFPVKFAVFLRIPFFKEHLWWLLLTVSLVVASKPNDDHLC